MATTTKKTEDLVEIELFLGDGKYADDVTVIDNGKAYIIKRGERVKVPQSVANILSDSKEQQRAFRQFNKGLTDEYNKAVSDNML